MKASKMIARLQKLIGHRSDLDVNMLSLVFKDGTLVGEALTPIRQIKYHKKVEKFFTDFVGGF